MQWSGLILLYCRGEIPRRLHQLTVRPIVVLSRLWWYSDGRRTGTFILETFTSISLRRERGLSAPQIWNKPCNLYDVKRGLNNELRQRVIVVAAQWVLKLCSARSSLSNETQTKEEGDGGHETKFGDESVNNNKVSTKKTAEDDESGSGGITDG